eukprot:498167-Karenia_brevis.AAC.1
MENFKKTTMVKYRYERLWQVFEDRADPSDYGEIYDCDRMFVFLQERKRNRFGEAFYCVSRELEFDAGCNQFVTLSQKQHSLIDEDIQETTCEDHAATMCLKATEGAKDLKTFGTNIFKVFATILCLLSLVTHGIVGAQTQRASTVGAA